MRGRATTLDARTILSRGLDPPGPATVVDDDPIFRSILGVPGMAGTSKSFMCGKGSFHIVKESQGEREAERARERGERAYELAVNVAKQKCGFSQPANSMFLLSILLLLLYFQF